MDSLTQYSMVSQGSRHLVKGTEKTSCEDSDKYDMDIDYSFEMVPHKGRRCTYTVEEMPPDLDVAEALMVNSSDHEILAHL